jgi:hypothetical protein
MADTIIFRLIDRKTDQNSFFLNADGTEDRERKLDFTNTYGILNPFYVTEPGGTRKQYRYIAGCPTYDPVEQQKQGYVFNMENSLIQFKAGVDIVLDKSLGGVLANFLKIHVWNTKSPYHKPGFHDEVFFTYDPQEEVMREFADATDEDRAIEILIDLKKDKVRMRAVSALFPDTANLVNDEEIYLGLRRVALDEPTLFTNSIANRENQVLSDVLISQKLGVIGKDAKGWYFIADQGLILSTGTRGQKDAEAELVNYLMSKEGEVFYRQIVVSKQQKEIEITAPAGQVLEPEEQLEISGHGEVVKPTKRK